MTDEQIRQDAIRYLGKNYDKEQLDLLLSGETQPHPVHEEPLIRAYIAGAHSRDKEIESLRSEMMKYRDNSVQIAAGEIGKLQEDVAFYKAQYESIKKELNQLRNPWRDAKKEPPEEYKNRRSKPVLIRYGIDYTHYDVWRYNYEKHYWENMSIYPMTAPDYWMPIPELNKGE